MYYQQIETSTKFEWSHAWKKALDALQQTVKKKRFYSQLSLQILCLSLKSRESR